MPDFERVIDQFQVEMAKTEEERCYARGYIAGKTRARKELLWIVLFAAALILLLLIMRAI